MTVVSRTASPRTLWVLRGTGFLFASSSLAALVAHVFGWVAMPCFLEFIAVPAFLLLFVLAAYARWIRAEIFYYWPDCGHVGRFCCQPGLRRSAVPDPPGARIRLQRLRPHPDVRKLDYRSVEAGTLGPWARHTRSATATGVAPPLLELTDAPTVFYGHSRTLYFHVVVSSGPNGGCAHARKEVWAKQVLDEAPANADHPRSETQFYNGAKE